MHIGETGGDGVQQMDGWTKLKLWREEAGGHTRGRVYGTTDLYVNLRHGCTSLTQQSSNPHGSMSGMSLEVERAARLRVQQVAENALAQAQEAKEENCKLANDVNALRALLMERLGEIDKRSTGRSCNGSHPPSHPDYDDALDEESLDEQSLDGDA
ncbi:hypothetical protein TSUD_284280 [Trifolium subterraneum]|uniref:Uncharacterized protein n=1 Tax=Trifolium subterraneum TaxID=3900 RepID=A0A2Z6PA64_TRISU|nr:hypothetical protein TSUD_284280 [Trifolium subterraneum]